MTTNELKALVLYQRAEMLFYRNHGGDIMDACPCIERCAYYLNLDGANVNHGAFLEYTDEDFQTGTYDSDLLWNDIVLLRDKFSHAGRNFMFNLEDF